RPPGGPHAGGLPRRGERRRGRAPLPARRRAPAVRRPRRPGPPDPRPVPMTSGSTSPRADESRWGYRSITLQRHRESGDPAVGHAARPLHVAAAHGRLPMVVATPCAGETAVSPPPVPHGRGHPVARRVRTRHDGAMDDSGGGAYSRNETASERLDRNWNEILQETRVTQTGIQILTGFLLTVPFQQRFTELTEQQRMFYLGLVLLAAVTTGLVVAPVSLHRWLFRRRAKDQL